MSTTSTIMYIQPFTTVVDYPEIGCLMEVHVSTMFYICRYCVFTWKSRSIHCLKCVLDSKDSWSRSFDFFLTVGNRTWKKKDAVVVVVVLLGLQRFWYFRKLKGEILWSEFLYRSAPPSKNAVHVSAFQMSCKLLSFTLEDSCRS